MRTKSAKIRNRPGPKGRSGVARYPGGQIVHAERKGESKEDVTAIALSHRLGRVHRDDADKPRAGYPLGRMRLNTIRGEERWLISEAQCRAGERWFDLVAAYLRAIDAPPPTARSCAWEGGGGKSVRVTPEMDPNADGDAVASYLTRLRERRSGYTEAVDAIENSGAGWPDRLFVLNAVVIRDRDEMSLSDRDLGDLRSVLNTLVRHFDRAALDRRGRMVTTALQVPDLCSA